MTHLREQRSADPAIGIPGEGLRMYDELADWFHLLTRATGFEPSVTTDPWERDVFIGVRRP